MVALNLAYDLSNLTPANANPVQSNFQRIEQFINTELINRDGSVAMTQQLKLVANPVAPLDAATKQYVDLLLPVGVMLPYPAPGSAPGAGTWALAEGQALSTADFPELFSKYAYTYTATPGGGSFNLPDMRGMTMVGAGTAGATQPEGNLGATIGAHAGNKDAAVVTHQHGAAHAHTTTSQVMDLNHYHQMSDHTHYGTTSLNGAHGHGWNPADFLYNEDPPTGFGLTNTGSIRTARFQVDAGHQHTMTTGGPSNNSTNWWHESPTANNRYFTPNTSVNTNNLTTDPAGGSATNRNMPPYVAVQFIIRVK